MAADGGYVTADLGEMYLNGSGVERDVTKGVSLIRRAAMDGDPEAAFSLGEFLRDGNYVTRDDVEALVWFIIAAEARVANDERIPQDYVASRDALRQKLDSEERRQADERAKQILDRLEKWNKTG